MSEKFEDPEKLGERKRVWEWAVTSVTGSRPDFKLPCAHLVEGSDKYDICHLVRNVEIFLGSQNFTELSEDLENFYSIKYVRGEDIFHFFARLDKA